MTQLPMIRCCSTPTVGTPRPAKIAPIKARWELSISRTASDGHRATLAWRVDIIILCSRGGKVSRAGRGFNETTSMVPLGTRKRLAQKRTRLAIRVVETPQARQHLQLREMSICADLPAAAA